jgi:hypothetical protein
MPYIPYSVRDKHVHIVGKTGMGKSSLISFWVWNDIQLREGAVCVIDPKGTLIDTMLRYIPDDRVDDVIIADITDPLPLDFIKCPAGQEDRVVADLKFILMGGVVDPTIMPIINDNIEALLYTFTDANRHSDLNTEAGKPLRCTFLDLERFLTEDDRRSFILRHVSNPKNKHFWDRLPSEADKAKILTRIRPFTRSETLSKIMGDPLPRLDIAEVINKKQVLFLRLPVQNPMSSFYGSLVMSKIQHATFSRDHIPEHERIPFYVYVDEFQHFQGAHDFHNVLDMGRDYKLCMTISITRLEPLSTNLKSALGIVSSFIVFNHFPGDTGYYQLLIDRPDPNEPIRDKLESLRLSSFLASWDDFKTHEKYAKLSDYSKTLPAPNVKVSDALDFPEFKAIYKIGNSLPVIEDTPRHGSREATENQKRKIAHIRQHSQDHYGYRAPSAQSGTIRAGDNSSSNSPQVRQDEVNGNSTPQDQPQPGETPNVPSHSGKKTDPRNPR